MNVQKFSNVTLPTFVLNYQGYAVGKKETRFTAEKSKQKLSFT